jgi:hypothetical protein
MARARAIAMNQAFIKASLMISMRLAWMISALNKIINKIEPA